MLERIQALFSAKPVETQLPPEDAKHALGALLVRAAKADNAYLYEEVEVIDQILADLHGLNPVEAAKMRAACELLEDEIPRTADLAHILVEAIDLSEREAAIAVLWKVVFADGYEADAEDTLLDKTAEALGVSLAVNKRLRDEALKTAREG